MVISRTSFRLQGLLSSDNEAEPDLDFGSLELEDSSAETEESEAASEVSEPDDSEGSLLDDREVEAEVPSIGAAELGSSGLEIDLPDSESLGFTLSDSDSDASASFDHQLSNPDDLDGLQLVGDFEMTAIGGGGDDGEKADPLLGNGATSSEVDPFQEGVSSGMETRVEYPSVAPQQSDQGVEGPSDWADGADMATVLEPMPKGPSANAWGDRFDATQHADESARLDELETPEFSPGPSLQGEQLASAQRPRENALTGTDSASASGQFQGQFQGFGMESQVGEPDEVGEPLSIEGDDDEELTESVSLSDAETGVPSADETNGPDIGDDFRLTLGDSEVVSSPGLQTEGENGAISMVGGVDPVQPLVAIDTLAFDKSGLVKPQTRVGPGQGIGGFSRVSKFFLSFTIAGLMTVAVSLFTIPYLFSAEELRVLARELGLEETLQQMSLLEPEIDVSMPKFEEIPIATPIEPVRPVLVPTENKSYFQNILGFIRTGEPYKATAAMNQPPNTAFRARYDLDMSSMAAARLNLLLAQSGKAEHALHHRCVVHVVELSAEICVHYLRALVGTGRYEEARTLLVRLKAARDQDFVPEALGMVERVLEAVEPRSPLSLANYFFYLIESPSHDFEWDRQEGLWLLKEIGNLEVSRWRDFAQILFQLRREEAVARLQSADFSKEKMKSVMGLTWFLDYLAVRFGFETLGFEHGSRSLPAADHRFANVVRVLASSIQGGSELDQALLHGIRSKEPYSEIERLMTINMAMQDRQLGKVFHLMSAHIDLIMRSRFGIEWKLLGALYAVEIGNKSMARKMYDSFLKLSTTEEEYVRSFDFWYTFAKLASFHGDSPIQYAERAQVFAFSQREQGLIEALRIEWFAKNRQFDKLNVSVAVQKYPRHYRVLSAAILALGHAGRDPKKIIQMQNRVSSSGLSEGREKNLLTDQTVRALLNDL
jgi:hypothetical protein